MKKITSVNEAYKAKLTYISGRPVAQIYKSKETKDYQRIIEDQLKMIDFKKEAPWIWEIKNFNFTIQATFNHGFYMRDLDNLLKATQDQVFRHLELNDSRIVELHAWKTIMPGAPDELICIKLSESNFQTELKGISEAPKKKKTRIFLGGTCSESTWRDSLIKQLRKEKISFFDPRVQNWNEEAREIEEKEKNKKCNFLLYVITSEMKGPYSLAEAVDSAYKSKEGTDQKVLLYIDKTGFSPSQVHSLLATVELVQRIGKNNIKAVLEDGQEKLMDHIKYMIL